MRFEQKTEEVVIAIIVRNNHVAIVRRAVPEGSLVWQFPAGKIQRKESEQRAVVREAREETGLNCRPRTKLGERIAPGTQTKLHYWLCDYLTGRLCVKSTKEITAARWVTPKNALKLITSDVYEPLKSFLLNANEE